jgi:hypothetical protein
MLVMSWDCKTIYYKPDIIPKSDMNPAWTRDLIIHFYYFEECSFKYTRDFFSFLWRRVSFML